MNIMKAIPYSAKRLLLWESAGSQPKINGIRCKAIIHSADDIRLFSSIDNRFTNMVHIEEKIRQLVESFPGLIGSCLDGELYIPGADFSKDLSSIVKTQTIDKRHASVQFWMFDIIMNEMQRQFRRLSILETLARTTELLKFPEQDFPSREQMDELLQIADTLTVVPTFKAVSNNMIQVISYLVDLYREAGFEGAIIRNLDSDYECKYSTNMMKLKPGETDVYKITGFKEEFDKHGKAKGRLGAFICIGHRNDTISVGTGFTAEQRAGFWEARDRLIGRSIVVSYQYRTPRSVRHPSFVKIYIEGGD